MIPLTGHQGCLILLAVASIAAGAAGWTLNGWRMSGQIERLNAGHATYVAEQQRLRSEAEAKYRQAEKAAAGRIASVYDAYREVERNAEIENSRLRADIESGRRRLSVAARCPAGSQMPGAAGNTGRADAQTRAEFNPEDAGSVIAITDDGDAAIRQLNALIDLCGR